jgi:uroporphyrinogen-III synthase
MLICMSKSQWIFSFIGPATVNSYLLRAPAAATTMTFSFVRNFRQTVPTRAFSSNDDDDDDSIDRDMGRIGWGKTVLSEALLASSTSNEEYVLPDFELQEQSTTTSSSSPDSTSAADETTSKISIGIALTREDGKNDALASAIQSCAELMQENQYAVTLQTYEVPCIQHADGPDFDQLKEILFEQATSTNISTVYDYVVITSPEAARVLASAWPWTGDATETTSTNSPVKVVAVGKATEVALRDAGIDVSFVPSKATAQTLVKELPPVPSTRGDRVTNVLYPASAKAADVIVNGLEERTVFSVTRLDSYDTVPAPWDTTQEEQAQQCQIVCFASPSAIKGWITNIEAVGINPNRYVAACIGETSAAACRKFGWDDSRIFYPKEQPGMEGWVEAVMEAAATIAADSTYVDSIEAATQQPTLTVNTAK